MITWQAYFERVSMLHLEFRLAGQAIRGWAHSQEALDQHARDQLEELRGMFRGAEEEREKELWMFSDENRINDYLAQVRNAAPQRVEVVENRLLQHEYILHVSIFEEFLKSIHRGILRATPTLLRPDRQIELGRLLSQGQEAIIAAEVEREVQALDRETVNKKSNYFRDKLGINWFDGRAAPILERALDRRNKIVHEDPDRPINDSELKVLSLATTSVVFATVAGAAILYPTVCALPDHMQADEAKMFVCRRP